MSRFIFMIIALLGAISCRSDWVYSSYVPVNYYGWHSDSLKQFVVNVDRDMLDMASLNLSLNLRRGELFKYSNILIYVDCIYPDGSFKRDSVNLDLNEEGVSSPKFSGGISDNIFPTDVNILLSDTGQYYINIRHDMGVDSDLLRGVSDIGIRLDR